MRPKQRQTVKIGERLRHLRKLRGLTQAELARQIGIQQSDLSRMEKGTYRVSLDNLFKILAVFGMDIAEFFADRQPAPAPAAEPLSQADMQILHALRKLSPDARREVAEFIQFKSRLERSERGRAGLAKPAEDGKSR